MTTLTRKQQSAFPEVAVIRKGGAKKRMQKNGREIEVVGDDLKDHFRVVFAPGAEELAGRFREVYGSDQVTKIHAMIPFASVAKAWEYYSEAYNAGRLIARANEDRFIVLRHPLTGAYEVMDGEPYREFRPGMKIEYDRDGRHYALPMKCTGRLRLWLPEVCMIPGPEPKIRMVYFTLKTTSFYDCMNISANLRAVQDLAEALPGQNASTAGIPIILYRKEQEITWNRPDGGAQRVKKWLIQIEMDPRFVAAAFQRMSQFALTGAAPAGLFTSGAVSAPPPATEIALDVDPEEDGVEEPEDDGYTPPESSEGDFRPETQAHPPIDPPVVERTAEPQPETFDDVLKTAPRDSSGKLERPMAPATLRAGLNIKAGRQFAGKTASQKQVGLVAMLIESVFSGLEQPSKIRHSITHYLFGIDSLNEAAGPVVLALLDWLNPTQVKDTGEYLVDKTAAAELTAVWPESQREAGQMSLF